jgi:hypothetical protein
MGGAAWVADLEEVVWGCLKFGRDTPEAELALDLAEFEDGARDLEYLRRACERYALKYADPHDLLEGAD